MRDTRYPWETAYPVALDICSRLRKACERIEVAGSLRRHKDTVGDIEILYIPVVREEVPDGRMFPEPVNQAEGAISRLISEGVLGLRLTVESRTTYGPLNKLMVHVASAIPVDLFAATRENWWNYLVCRTGPAELNAFIASKAKTMGWRWHPYGSGFSTVIDGGDALADREETRVMHSEAEVFEFVGIPYRDPPDRV